MRLKPFQRIGRDFLAARRYAYLGDQMRLGKTLQTIAALDQIKAQRVLVVGPAIARSVWAQTSREFGRGPLFHELTAPCANLPKRVVCSYHFAREFRAWLCKTQWDVLVIDEAHYMRSPERSQTKALLGKQGVARQSYRVWCLSGTPAPSHVGELWVILRTFGVTRDSYDTWLRQHCRLDRYGRPRHTLPGHDKEVLDMMRPVFLRRTKKQVAPELGAAGIYTWQVKPRSDAVEAFWPVNSSLFVERAKAKEEKLNASELSIDRVETWLKSARYDRGLSEMRQYHGLAKVPAVAERILWELDQNYYKKLVVFYWHSKVSHALEALLKDKVYVAKIAGSVDGEMRKHMISKFNQPQRPAIILAQIAAAGVAIDLSAASNAIMVERSWVPADNEQAIERLCGYNQTEPVVVLDAVLAGFDRRVRDVLRAKSSNLKAFE